MDYLALPIKEKIMIIGLYSNELNKPYVTKSPITGIEQKYASKNASWARIEPNYCE